MIRRGGPRAVRLLDVTGVLERGVPTVAAAVARRRADPGELDPLRVLRFPTVAHVDELLDESAPLARGPATVKLAALVLDVLGLDATPTGVRRLLDELAADDPPGVEPLLSSARLLRAAAGDAHGYDRAELLQLAAQIGSTAALESATLLARASSPDRDDRLDQLHELVRDVLAHPDLLADDATVLADVRRRAAEALCRDEASIARLRAAPDSYVLTHEPDELARQAELIEPLPSRGTIRVAVSPEGTPDHWIVDVACRDTHGLLARLARALTAAGCDIAAATVATWPDGAAVDTFLVRSAVRPAPASWHRRWRPHWRSGCSSKPSPTSRWSSTTPRCRGTRCASRPVSIDPAPSPHWRRRSPPPVSVVHSARVTTIDGRLADRFALTDRLGRKLDDRSSARIRAALTGTISRRSRRNATQPQHG